MKIFTAPNKDANRDIYPSLNKLNPLWLKVCFSLSYSLLVVFVVLKPDLRSEKSMGTEAFIKDHEGHYYHLDKTILAKECNNHASHIQCNDQ